MRRFPVRIKPIKVDVNPGVERQFGAVARSAFPYEAFAYLMGVDLGDRIEIETILLPPRNGIQKQTPDEINTRKWVLWEAVQWGRENDLSVVGDIHTHPLTLAEARSIDVEVVPSEGDWKDVAGFRWVTGICAVREQPSGRLRLHYRYWGPLTPLTINKRKT